MADYGAKTSQSGYDVVTATDKQLVFSSKFNSLKISKEGSFSRQINNGATETQTISHGLGYAPSHVVFGKMLNYNSNDYWVGDGMGVFALPLYDPSSAETSNTSLGDSSYFSAYSDGTNLNVEIYNGSGSTKTFDMYYYILIEDNS